MIDQLSQYTLEEWIQHTCRPVLYRAAVEDDEPASGSECSMDVLDDCFGVFHRVECKRRHRGVEDCRCDDGPRRITPDDVDVRPPSS